MTAAPSLLVDTALIRKLWEQKLWEQQASRRRPPAKAIAEQLRKLPTPPPSPPPLCLAEDRDPVTPPPRPSHPSPLSMRDLLPPPKPPAPEMPHLWWGGPPRNCGFPVTACNLNTGKVTRTFVRHIPKALE
jgi:hypothetical protein